MSKEHRNWDDDGRHEGGSNGIPSCVKRFGNLDLKKYKKELKKDGRDFYESKKELKRAYFDMLVEFLPGVIDWLLKNGHKPQEHIQEAKMHCYERISGFGDMGPAFIEHTIKYVKKYGTDEAPELVYFPIILFEIIGDILKFNKDHEAKPEECYASPDEMYELCMVLLKKRLKKAEKKNIPENLAFDLLCVVPTKDTIGQYGTFYRARLIFDILYKYAAEMAIPFDTIIDFLVDSADYKYILGYALQERKDKYKGYNENQKVLYNGITSWTMNTLEDMDKKEIREILENYIRARKRDEAAGKDGVRRYYLTSLPDSDYPKICAVVDQLLQNESNKKYL